MGLLKRQGVDVFNAIGLIILDVVIDWVCIDAVSVNLRVVVGHSAVLNAFGIEAQILRLRSPCLIWDVQVFCSRLPGIAQAEKLLEIFSVIEDTE